MLVATHAPTHSRVVVAVLHASENVGRAQCEDLARAARVVPDDPLRTLEDEVATTQGTFDTRVRVALASGSGPRDPLVGHVMAFGGFLHKCFAFDFTTEVGGAADEPALSARLAFARARILSGLEIDAVAQVPASDPAGRDGPSAR
jgi:hypothetical protein